MSTATAPQRSLKWWVLYLLAIGLFLTGVAILILRDDFVCRTFAVIAFVVSARLVRMAVQSRSVSSAWQTPDSKVAKGPGRLLWGASIAMLPLAALSYLSMYRYHTIWAVDMFAGVAVVCALVWSCLAYKLVR